MAQHMFSRIIILSSARLLIENRRYASLVTISSIYVDLTHRDVIFWMADGHYGVE